MWNEEARTFIESLRTECMVGYRKDQYLALSDALARIDELEAIVAKMPRTADGVPIVAGDKLWCLLAGGFTRQIDVKCGIEGTVMLDGDYYFTTCQPGDCYSTKEAADAALASRGPIQTPDTGMGE